MRPKAAAGPTRRRSGRPASTACSAISGPPCFMKRRVDPAPSLRGDPGHAFELVLARGEQPLRRAEVLHEGALPCRADAWKRVEDRRPRLRVAALAVETEGEAMGL